MDAKKVEAVSAIQLEAGRRPFTGRMDETDNISVLGVMVRNEWIKQGTRRKIWIFGILSALLPVALAVLQGVLLPGQAILAREDLFLTSLRLIAPLVLPLMAATLALDAFTDEIGKGSIRSTLFLPAGRATVYWAKALSILAGSAFATGTMWLSSVLSGLFLPGRDSWLVWLGTGLAATAASLLPTAFIIATVMVLAQFMKSAGGILVSLVIGSLGLNLLSFLVKDLAPVLPVTWLGYGASAMTLPPAGLLAAFAVLAAWTTLFGMAGWLRFERRGF